MPVAAALGGRRVRSIWLIGVPESARISEGGKTLSRNGLIAIAVVVVVFALVGGFLLFRGQGGGQDVTINLDVRGGTMEPSAPSAHQGDNITLTLTADRKEEIHLHGYDIHFDLEPGKPVTKTFKADRTCGCEIEVESTSQHLGELTVSPR